MYLTIVKKDESKYYMDLDEDVTVSHVKELCQTISLNTDVKSVFINFEPLKRPKTENA